MNSFCIIGLGKFGTSLANALVDADKQVMVIDTDPEKVTLIADHVTNAVIGDATNMNLLKASGVADYDCAVVCMTENISDIILVTIQLKELGVKYVISRAVNDGHRKVLEHVGADQITYPEHDMGERLAFRLSHSTITDFVQFKGYKVVEMAVPESWVGKDLITLNLRKSFGVNVIAVRYCDGRLDVSPSPTREFNAGEIVSIVGDDHDIERMTEKIK
ncbi:MAG: TrkA family potassium uptake protein [Clostridia bacterium]|nr:TrkA family potassium uptake protein [Clostridia bacterium]